MLTEMQNFMGADDSVSKQSAGTVMSIRTADWASEQLMRHIERSALPENLGALLDAAAAAHGDRCFLEFFEDGERVSYAEIGALTRRIAAGLRAIGVARASHVAVMLPTSRLYPLSWLSLARIGAVTIPINFGYTPRELAYTLREAGAEYLIIHRDFVPVLEDIEGGCPLARENVLVAGGSSSGFKGCWEDLADSTARASPHEAVVGHDDLMNIQFTSGTTGFPKGAMQSQRFWLGFARVGAAQFQNRPRRILIAQPLYYLDGQWLVLMALTMGATAYVARRMSAGRFLEWMQRYRIEYCNFPEVVSKQAPHPSERMDHLVAMSCYSHRKSNYPAYEQRYGGLARQGFSMTEVGCGLYVPMEAHGMTGTGTVGIPVAFREAMVTRDDGRAAGPGEPGELRFRGPGMTMGYYGHPEATAAAFHEQWFRTGDVAVRDERGWFYYLGRIKDLVRRSSENISAVEVEGVLRALPEVLEAAVLAVPDELRGEEVKAYLMLATETLRDQALIERIFEHCRQNLAAFKIPRYLELVDEFPRTPGLKIRKSALREAKPDLRTQSYDRVDGLWR
jgi:crotonobetaine/carnitine-CoA ligase